MHPKNRKIKKQYKQQSHHKIAIIVIRKEQNRKKLNKDTKNQKTNSETKPQTRYNQNKNPESIDKKKNNTKKKQKKKKNSI